MAKTNLALLIPVCYGCVTCTIYMWVLLAVTGFVQLSKTNTLSYRLNGLTQVSRDWITHPFIDIKVTDADTCPDSHPDMVLYRPFYGTRIGCDCLGIYHQYIY